ncbi:MAG: DNA-processing protein DprA, partial [Candidatus Saccharimonadales bacterium]
MKINTISPDSSDYLQGLNEIAKPPKTLRYIGTVPAVRIKTVAIVGTRRPSAYGKEVTYRLSYDLAKRGILIVSGLALGVDGIAHTAALEAGGLTIAVLGNGLPEVQPATNRKIAEQIIAGGGGIISEYEDYTDARPHHFLERNRLVAGLADAIVITEAATRSGTLNTAAHALAQGIEIFVVPGNITSPLSAGCNMLLKQGARAVTNYQDILDIIAPEKTDSQQALPLGNTKLETKIIQIIAAGQRDGEDIMSQTGADTMEFNTALTMLELSGAIRP